MPKNRLDTLLHRFAVAARAHHAALEAMDGEGASNHARMTGALFKAIITADSSGKERFIALLEHADPVVAGMAAVYTITRDSGPSLTTLRRVAKEPGLLGFRAAAAIDRWQNGEWE